MAVAVWTLKPDLLSVPGEHNVSGMRYLAWVAVFSLQMGMFVCGAGIDVCHAADTPAETASLHAAGQASDIGTTSADHSPSGDRSGPVEPACSAHAAHVFLGLPDYGQTRAERWIERLSLPVSLNLPEIFNLIEQPPRPFFG